MKRLFALALAAMMSCALLVNTSFAARSPELERGVVITMEVAGEAADRYKDTEFRFTLDVSKAGYEDSRWESFARKAGIAYDAEGDVLQFSLKAGGKITLDLPFGDGYVVTEVDGYASEDYLSTTVNGVEAMEHTFDVSRKDSDYDMVAFVNTYGKEETPVDPVDPPVDPVDPPVDPDVPGPGQPDIPGGDGSGAEQPGKPGTGDPNGEKPVSPQTGYPVGILALSVAAAASGAVAVAAGRKAGKN